MNNIKAIIFDYDYTLGDREIAAFNKYSDFVAKMMPELDKSSFEFDAVVYDLLQWDMHGNFDKNFVILQFNQKYHKDFKLTNVENWWNDDFYKYSVLYQDTKPVLEILKNKYKLGIISNGDAFGQRKKIELVGLNDYFAEILIGGDFKKGKPDSLIFETMLKKMNIKAENAIYVGDIFSIDVIGANNLNIHPILIKRDGPKVANSKIVIIKDLWELLEKLENSQVN